MSKKSNRSKAKFKYTPKVPDKATSNNEEPAKSIRTMPQTSAAFLTSLQEQYKYIKPELYRILIISAVFFIILIVLSFIIG